MRGWELFRKDPKPYGRVLSMCITVRARYKNIYSASCQIQSARFDEYLNVLGTKILKLFAWGSKEIANDS